jgi:pimeloyl-ACP methyl ester carboxylesterase
VTVHGWVHGEPATARALLLLFHQGGANARAEYDPIIPRLLEEGYAVLAIDQRAGGDMLGGENRTAHALGGDPHYCDAYPDLEAALAYGREQVPGRPIVVWGSSYSGALALRLAMDNPDLAGLVGFSPAGGEAMGSCPASRFAEHVTVPTLVLRPASELEIDYVRADWEAWGTRGFERHIADPGRHGSSMLNPMRVEGDV